MNWTVFSESKRVLSVGLLALLAAALMTHGGQAGIFGMDVDDYPGGTLKVTVRFEDPQEDAPPRTYTVTIEPNGDKYDVTEEVSSPGRPADDVTTAFGASGGAGATGSRYEEDDEPNIDLTPLTALDDRDVEIAPNQNYLLPDGARLVTQGRDEVAGLGVVMGTFLHPNYPNQRVNLAFADRETRDLLLFPPLFEREEGGEVEVRVELVEFSYQP